QSYNSIGYVQDALGNFDAALTLYTQTLDIRQRKLGPEHPDVAKAQSNIGLLHWNRGDYDAALEALDEALRIRRAAYDDEHPEVGASYLNLGLVYDTMGDDGRAGEYYERALTIVRNAFGTEHPWVAEVYKNLGALASETGDDAQALSYYEQALAILQDQFGEGHPELAPYLYNIGRVYLDQEDSDTALSYYERGLQIDRDALGDNHPSVAMAYDDIGTLHLQRGDLPEAQAAFEQALALNTAIYGDQSANVARSHLNLAAVDQEAGRIQRALEHYQQALVANLPGFNETNPYITPPLLAALDDEWLLLGLRDKGAVFAQRFTLSSDLADLEAAHASFERAGGVVNRMWSSYRAEDSKLFLAENVAPLYDQAIQTTLTLHELTGEPAYLERAWTYVEQSKAGTLRDAFNEAQAPAIAGLPDSLLTFERRLRTELARSEQAIREEIAFSGDDAPLVQRMRASFFDRQQRYEQLIRQIEQDYPNYYALKYDRGVTTPADLQRTLLRDGNAALVSYYVGAENVHILALTSDSLTASTVRAGIPFVERVRALRQSVVTSDYDQYIRLGHEVYQQLVGPVASHVGEREIIVVPAGVLHVVPFEALLTEPVDEDGVRDYRTLPYLLSRQSVRYAYSATLLASETGENQAGAEVSAGELLAFAPIFGDAAPGPTRHEASYLPATREEVQSIRDLFASKLGWASRLFGGGPDVFTGREATEDRFKRLDTGRYAYVHLATHGFVDADDPALSGLAFARGDDGGEDGILYLGELYTLNLDAELVVLSACETGLGRLATGEGVIGLTRGFLFAGAENVMVSLWQVDDASTAQLMETFYSRLLSGLPKATALREAKQALIASDPRYARPYFWSTFVLVE
ncbi:MAG: tetratricopeptide repeat protein, partial [Bacteroidota bacterium]